MNREDKCDVCEDAPAVVVIVNGGMCPDCFKAFRRGKIR